ncbi:MAG: CinA family nicotinamide mononucleotide deamidase-related protein [Chloroflexaceae bacterium]|nr:CinA family nicotinamide mononucleotide deamidase-related protein [Chloroflexaceae bacterium]
MDAEIVAIGSELLLGTTVDTNSTYLARQLAAAGINVYRKQSVGDNAERIAACISEALARADLIICTGGLGPTVDDVTREGVALAFGRPLEFRQDLFDQISARFAARRRPMSESNRRQAFVPQGARAIENRHGTAPAFLMEDKRGTVIVLPGVPLEMRNLYAEAVLPYLRDERGIRDVILVRVLHAVGMGESVIGERIADLMGQSNPTVGISAKQARYELRIGAKATSHAEAEAMIARTAAILEERLGTALLGDEPLDQQVARLLHERNLSLALYEGHAAAPIYTALRAAMVAVKQLQGIIVHPLDTPTDAEGATSLAIAGAASVRERWRSDLAIGMQAASQSDETGATAVSVALATPEGVATVQQYYDLNQDENLSFIGTLGLNVLRRYLLGEA